MASQRKTSVVYLLLLLLMLSCSLVKPQLGVRCYWRRFLLEPGQNFCEKFCYTRGRSGPPVLCRRIRRREVVQSCSRGCCRLGLSCVPEYRT